MRKAFGAGNALWCDQQAGAAGLDRAAARGGASQALSSDAGRAACVHCQNEDASAHRDSRHGPAGVHMSEHRHHWLTRLYPPAWRARYGDEMDELLSEQCDWRQVADVARAALIERLFHSTRTGADIMRTYPVSTRVLVRKPSAIVPIAMSLAALAVVLVAIGIFGARHQADEGA